MPISANATRLKERLREIAQGIRLSPYALSEVAVSTIADVTSNAFNTLGGREDQVGFDLSQFISNIRDPGPLQVNGAQGTVGILHTPTMGTQEDLDAIMRPPRSPDSLWHQGQRRGDLFRLKVYEILDVREELGADRRAVWGEKTPQWYLLENGTLGVEGAYPQMPPAHFIASATRADRLSLRLRNAMMSLFRGIPRR